MINQYYLSKIDELKRLFEKEGQLHLTEFFDETSYNLLQKKMKKLSFKPMRDPLHHSFKQAKAFSIEELSSFIHQITGIKPTFVPVSFGWKDYTVLHDDYTLQNGVDCIIQLCAWDDRFGGTVVYTDGEGNSNVFSSYDNSIIIKKRTEQRFIKYVNHHAKDRKYMLITL